VYNDGDFCDKIGRNRTAVSECANGRRPITKFLVKAITDTFPDVNGDWLLFEGETSMYVGGPATVVKGVQNNVNNGHDQTIGAGSRELLETIRRQQEQIDRLLGIIEKLQG
jgi:hypothetical protein